MSTLKDSKLDHNLLVRAPRALVKLCKRAAAADGRPMAVWVRRVLDAAARAELARAVRR